MKVIFDLGNVILNWNANEVLCSLDIESYERNLLRKDLFEHRDWLDLDCGKFTEESVVARVVERSGLAVSIVEQAFQSARESLIPIPASIQLLNEIYAAGIETYCLSNMSVETYKHIKDREFFNLFKGIVISGKEKCIKPDAQIFKLIIERYDLNPSRTLFIDDNLPNVEAANKLNLIGFHFQRTKECYAKIRELLK